MGYVYLLMVAFFFSFGGTSVKLIKPYFNPYMITFLRFFVGVLWLLGLKAVTHRRSRKDFLAQLRAHGGWLVLARWPSCFPISQKTWPCPWGYPTAIS